MQKHLPTSLIEAIRDLHIAFNEDFNAHYICENLISRFPHIIYIDDITPENIAQTLNDLATSPEYKVIELLAKNEKDPTLSRYRILNNAEAILRWVRAEPERKLFITSLRECKLKENPNSYSMEILGEGQNFAQITFNTARNPIFVDIVNLVNGNLRIDITGSNDTKGYRASYEFDLNKKEFCSLNKKD